MAATLHPSEETKAVTESTTAVAREPTPIESGFIAAGVTISTIAGFQTLAILLRWILVGF